MRDFNGVRKMIQYRIIIQTIMIRLNAYMKMYTVIPFIHIQK